MKVHWRPARSGPDRSQQRGGLWRCGCAAAALLLGGCMAMPDISQRPWSAARPPAQSGPLAATASASVPAGDLSGFRLLVSGAEALQARLALIERAQVSLDLQYYQFKGDASGRRLMRALRDAAARGVRVRVLIDDLYNAGDDALWLDLAAHDGVEVRLFNPFMAERDSVFKRLVETAVGEPRMHRRMHNKMLVADSVFAVAGGRNIADAYLDGGAAERYFDIDLLVAGHVVEDMGEGFDLYWNSAYTHALNTVVEDPLPPAVRRRRFADRMAADCAAGGCGAQPPSAALLGEFERTRIDMRLALASVSYDSPEKIENEQVATDITMLATTGAQVRLLVAQSMLQAIGEIMIVSPYLIPGETGIKAMRDFRTRGVRIVLLTNSLAATDEPSVHLGYRKYRIAALREGVELYEWSPARGSRVLRELVAGGTVLRLHAKAAVIDRSLVYLGSMNFDPRSRDLNTEFGLLVRSPELAEEVRALIQRMASEGAYRVQLDTDGKTLRWTARDGGDAGVDVEPDTDLGSRLLLELLAPLVPEELL